MYKDFDVENWKRKDVFDFFKTYDDPFFGICTYIDITRLYTFCKANNHSLNLAILYYSTKTANEIIEFRLRFQDNRVVVFDQINCGSTILHDDETFSFCFIDFKNNLREFEELGKKVIENHLKTKTLDPKSSMLNVIHYSVIPWTTFSSIKHAKKFNQHDSIPKITFGKYFTENDIVKLPISIEVNHSLMDGFHVGKYLDLFQQAINGIN